MLKKCLFFFCLLSLAALAGCSSATKFSHFQIEETDTALVATGEVSLQGEDGVLLTIQALEPFSTTLHLTYSKEAGDVTVALGDAQQASLAFGAVDDTTADIPVSLAEGRNDISLSGGGCQVAYTAVLDVSDFSLVESFGTGTTR